MEQEQRRSLYESLAAKCCLGAPLKSRKSKDDFFVANETEKVNSYVYATASPPAKMTLRKKHT